MRHYRICWLDPDTVPTLAYLDTALDAVVRSEAAFAGVRRQRLVLMAAATTLHLVGRREDDAGRCDGNLLLRVSRIICDQVPHVKSSTLDASSRAEICSFGSLLA